MILPPPNITGDLHLGHALTVTIQDAIFRFQRMNNTSRACVYVPGFDHAGIATQAVIDRYLHARTGKRVYDLSQAEFHAEAERWQNQQIESIRNQLKQLGVSLDFGRETYTRDARISRAVTEAFIRLYERGLLYRQETIVNWCFALNSTISDMELKWVPIEKRTELKFPGHDHKVEFGYLYDFVYRLEGNSDRQLIVSTTRPCSIPADVAIAVNPADNRYQDVIGQCAIHPLTGERLPVVADERVQMDFGSGAVKITPSASMFDFEIAKSHGLRMNSLLDDKGCLKVDNLKPEFKYLNGINRFEAHNRLIDIFSSLEQYKGRRPHRNVIPLCSRTNDLIEYRVMAQWFLNMKVFNQELKTQIDQNRLQFVPNSYKNSLLDWISHERDWCVSRQIWWGHRIPMYRVRMAGAGEGWIAAKDEEEAKAKATEKFHEQQVESIVQETDVLDTWFSSALLPFAVFGWPQTTQDLNSFYPLSLMETGFDILKVWVHKMLALGWYLTGQLPFNQVLLHGMIVDSNGKKMSKSRGNVVNPTDVINGATIDKLQSDLDRLHHDGYLSERELIDAKKNQRRLFPEGLPKNTADGLRLCLYQYDLRQEVIKLDKDNIRHNRNLINKLWQGFQLFLIFESKLVAASHAVHWNVSGDQLDSKWNRLDPVNRWILMLLDDFASRCHQNMSQNLFQNVYKDFHHFWVEQFCGTYLELIKKDFNDLSSGPKQLDDQINTLAYCIQTVLLCIHPLVPFVSEELFQRLLHKIQAQDQFRSENFKSILQHAYPGHNRLISCANQDLDHHLVDEFDRIQTIANEIRSLKIKLGVNKKNGDGFHFQIWVGASDLEASLSEEYLKTLTRLSSIKIWTGIDDDHYHHQTMAIERGEPTFILDGKLMIQIDRQIFLGIDSDESSPDRLKKLYEKSKEKKEKVFKTN